MQVPVVYPAEVFCDDRTCYAASGEVSNYFDSHHLSIGGARRLVAAILRAAG